ncbi:MAG TPA: metallophosphoesterase, partial [Planctomycetota bacterium]|nr:metallophosphoesterase [Planctomycetota bacterium]
MTPRPLWFVGDVHLGRAAVTLPRALADHDVDALRLAPAAAFLRLIDAVLESEAEALVFAGDLVDSENARFEAYGLLERGVRRLVDAGVRVFAVAGNHD